MFLPETAALNSFSIYLASWKSVLAGSTLNQIVSAVVSTIKFACMHPTFDLIFDAGCGYLGNVVIDGDCSRCSSCEGGVEGLAAGLEADPDAGFAEGCDHTRRGCDAEGVGKGGLCLST
jgi:hypothetical protein